jgi:hypothetical protein
VRALFDVSVLLALFDDGHTSHNIAVGWWAANQKQGWASCAITQNGFVRIICQRRYPQQLPIASAITLLEAQTTTTDHEFWGEELSITDPLVFDRVRILGPNQITDAYLLALAVKRKGRLVTLDQAIPLRAVHGADDRHVVVLE